MEYIFVEKIIDYHKSFANENSLKAKYLGLNFLNDINSYKIYYQPNYSAILNDKQTVAISIFNKYFDEKIFKAIKQFLLYYNSSLLDMSFKKSNKKNDIRFTMRFSCKYGDVNSFINLLSAMGYSNCCKEINDIRNHIHYTINSTIDPLYIIGFNSNDGKVTNLKTYFRFTSSDVNEDYKNFELYHSNDLQIFNLIMLIINPKTKTKNNLFEIFKTFNKNKLFIDFLGIDFNLINEKIYKIYFNVSSECNMKKTICNFLVDNNALLSYINQFIKSAELNDFSIKGIGIAFSKEEILNFQVYFGE